MALTDYRPDAMRCTRCSYCKWIPFDLVKSHRFAKGCPSVEAGKFHAYSAGGKLITALSLMDGRSEVTEQVVDVAFRCQLCGNCDVTCKLCRYDMEPILALRELRAHLVEMDRVPDSYRPLIERTRAGLAGQSPVTPADRNAWAAGLGLADPATEPVDVVFYAGCKYSLEDSLRETVRTQARLLQQAGLTVGLFADGCCGGIADKMGYRAEAAEAGGRMLAQWAAAGVKTVVTPCADCRHVFTRLYPGLEGGAAMPEVLHTVELTDRLVKDGRLELTTPGAADGHLPRPLQPRPPGRALRALGRRREEDLRPGGGLRPAAAAPQRRARRLRAAARPARRDPRRRAPRDGTLPRGRLVLRRRRRLPRGLPRLLGGDRRRARGGGCVDRRRGAGHGLLALRAQLQRGGGRGRPRRGPRGPRRARARRPLRRPYEGGLMSPSYAQPTTPAATAAQSAQLSDDAYRALEDIVGAENVSRDAAILDNYAFQYLAELVRPEHSHFMPRHAAVALPASTEEVQAIVRLANKHGFKVKPHGTGWYLFNAAVKEDDPTVQLDMRRMNAIVEIDAQNMYAVVEPYVIHAQLQADVLKLGMNINIPGVGCSSSIVASACAYAGQGPFTYFLGGNAENVLGMEWVTPEGEIVRTGSLGSGDGWFCSEGPGPSVRGICRGAIGSRGGMGVYTKCAIKLGPSLGSEEWQVNGTLPAYRLPLAETQRAYTIAVPSWDAWADAYYEIYDNEIGYIFHRQFNLAGGDLAAAFWLMYNDSTKTLGDVPELAARPDVQELTEELRISFQLVLAGRSKADIELQDKILDDILEKVGGHKVERFREQDMAEFTNMYLQRLGHKHVNFVWAGGYIGSWMQFGTPDWVAGLRPGRPRRASNATPPAATSSSAAATR